MAKALCLNKYLFERQFIESLQQVIEIFQWISVGWRDYSLNFSASYTQITIIVISRDFITYSIDRLSGYLICTNIYTNLSQQNNDYSIIYCGSVCRI